MLLVLYDLPADFPVSLDHRRIHSIDRLLTSLFKCFTDIQLQLIIFGIIVNCYDFFFALAASPVL